MGAACAQSTVNLPSYKETLGGTTLPAWVSAGGRSLFEQAAELAKSPYPLYAGQRIASYGDSKLTPEEQQAADILSKSAGQYQPYLDKASDLAGGLGQGYGASTREDLLGDPYSGATRNDARARAAKSGAFGGSRLGITEATLGSGGAQSAGDLRSRAAAEGLGFAANRFDTDRAGRFQAENAMRSGFEQDRAARFGAEDAMRSGYETDEASRLRQQEIYTNMAPLIQGLNEQTAAGLISTGEAKRKLDQMALDMAYADYTDQKKYPYEQLNFAMGALQGTPYNQQDYSYNTQQQYAAGPSIYGQTIGGLGALGSAYFASKRN